MVGGEQVPGGSRVLSPCFLGIRPGEQVIAGFLVQRREWHSGCEKPYHVLMADSDLATSLRHVCAAAGPADAFNAIAMRIAYSERQISAVVVPIQVESEAGRGSTLLVVACTRAPGAVS